jgi:hypothetical protein
MIHEKLNRRQSKYAPAPKKVVTPQKPKEDQEAQEIQMGTARIKRKAQETNVIVFTRESGKSDDEGDGQSPHSENIKVDDEDDDDFERPDFSDSSADSFFSRDSNYILEEYQLFTELEPIEEVKDASPAERSLNQTAQKDISEHGFDTYNLSNP